MSARAGIWTRLGIGPTRDLAQIRRAYAQALKRTHPEDDPEGFAALRSAYEAALGWAQAGARGTAASVEIQPSAESATPIKLNAPTGAAPSRGSAVAGGPPPAGHSPQEPPKPPAEDPDLAPLRLAFQRLRQSLAGAPAPSSESPRSLLDTCLRSPALQSIAAALEFEDSLAALLWSHRARADDLIERAVTHFGWRGARRARPQCLALAAYADDIRPLREAQESEPLAYFALTRAPRLLLLWWRILRSRLDLKVEPIWRSLTVLGKALPPAVNQQALDWWTGYFTRPHPQPMLIRVAALLTALGGFIASAAESDSGHAGRGALLGALGGALIGVALTGAYLAAVDWPRHWLKDKARATTPLGRLSWIPAVLGLCLLTVIAPDTPRSRIVIGMLACAVFLWAAIVTRQVGRANSHNVAQRIWGSLLNNLPLAIWWAILGGGKGGFPPLVMWCSLIAAMGAFAFALPELFVEYRRILTPGMQRGARLGIAAAAAAMLAVLLWRPVDPRWRAALLMAMAIIALLQRVPALALTPRQLRLRYYLTVPGSLFVLAPLSQSGFLDPFRLCGALFMAGVLLSLTVCEYNEALGRWRERRATPVFKARL